MAIISDPAHEPLVLYTHWSGSELPDAVADGLRASRPRWEDDSYFARIVIHKVLDTLGAKPDEECGFGLSVGRLDDNSYPIIVLHQQSKTVHVVSENLFDAKCYEGSNISFEDALQDGAIRSLRESVE